MAGILVDIYGLDELPPNANKVSCLWLYHGRMGAKEDMADFATRIVDLWAQTEPKHQPGDRGLIAVAFDHRNHGTRFVSKTANVSWRDGNARHAIDMFGAVVGMVSDTRTLMDVIQGYLFPESGAAGVSEGHQATATAGETAKAIDRHLVLGYSLGGHSAWQIMFAEPRVQAGVVVVGCPDYMCECTPNERGKSAL
jgi:hypothetical protein